MCQVKDFSQMGYTDVHPLNEAGRFLRHYTFPHVVAVEVLPSTIIAFKFKSIEDALKLISVNQKKRPNTSLWRRFQIEVNRKVPAHAGIFFLP